jgi:hypothetical protein
MKSILLCCLLVLGAVRADDTWESYKVIVRKILILVIRCYLMPPERPFLGNRQGTARKLAVVLSNNRGSVQLYRSTEPLFAHVHFGAMAILRLGAQKYFGAIIFR